MELRSFDNQDNLPGVSKISEKNEKMSFSSVFYRMHEIRWIIFIFLLFSIIYSVISYLRYISFSENVLDLGVNASLAYNVVYGTTFFGQILHGGIAVNKLIYIPIGLIYGIYPKEYFLLFVQDFFLAFSGVVLYFLSYEFTKSKKISTVVSLLFFLYFPLAGVFWFDFHYMAFFPTFFLLGVYYYFRKETPKWSIFLILSAVTDLMAPVIVFLFLAIGVLRRKKNTGKFSIEKSEWAVALVSIVLFIIPNIYYARFYPGGYMGISLNQGIYSNPWFKAEFFLRILLPFLFIPLLGIEFLILLIPYGMLLFSNSYWPYESQLFFQYPSLYVPTLFIAFIVGLKRLGKITRNKKNIKKILTGILILNIVLFYLFTPIGNLVPAQKNDHPQEEYITGSSSNLYGTYAKIVPTKADIYLMSFINKIPTGSSVLVSGNTPEFLQGYKDVCLNSNFNASMPEYLVSDPYSYFFTSPIAYGITSNNTPLIKINYLLNNENYHLLYYYKGDAVYKYNSYSNTEVYGYISENISTSFSFQNGLLFYNIALLAPGFYNLTINKTLYQNATQLESQYKQITVIKQGDNYLNIKVSSFMKNIRIYLSVNKLTVERQQLVLSQYAPMNR